MLVSHCFAASSSCTYDTFHHFATQLRRKNDSRAEHLEATADFIGETVQQHPSCIKFPNTTLFFLIKNEKIPHWLIQCVFFSEFQEACKLWVYGFYLYQQHCTPKAFLKQKNPRYQALWSFHTIMNVFSQQNQRRICWSYVTTAQHIPQNISMTGKKIHIC